VLRDGEGVDVDRHPAQRSRNRAHTEREATRVSKQTHYFESINEAIVARRQPCSARASAAIDEMRFTASRTCFGVDSKRHTQRRTHVVARTTGFAVNGTYGFVRKKQPRATRNSLGRTENTRRAPAIVRGHSPNRRTSERKRHLSRIVTRRDAALARRAPAKSRTRPGNRMPMSGTATRCQRRLLRARQSPAVGER
jgi:hypothetical protein